MTPYLPGVLFQSCPLQVQLSSCPPPHHPPYYPHREVHTTSSPICCLPLYLSFSWLLSPMSLIPTLQWDPDNSMHYAWQTIVRTTSEQNTLYLSLQHFLSRIPTVNTRFHYTSFYVYSFFEALTFRNTGF